MLNQNITPSLRQSMINEALNYHQNMNSVVFRREPHSIQVYNNPSGKTDPSQTDIIVEGNIRSRITEIQSAITKLNQTLVYASSEQVAPVYGSGSPSGGVKPPKPGRSLTPTRFPRLPPGPVRAIQPPPTPAPRAPLPPVEIPSGPVVPGRAPIEPSGEFPDIERQPEADIYGSEPFETESDDPGGVEERKEGREDEPEGSDEPIAPGPVTVHAPSSVSAASHKTRMIIDNSLAGILSAYNALIDFIELQTRQKLLSSKDSQIISGLLKELIPSLKTTIISAQRTTKKGQPDTQVDYTRIYNVVSGIIDKIAGSPPFLKVDPQLLSESLPIRRDIINAVGFDAQKGKNHVYFENLLDRLKDEELKLFKFHPKSAIEKQAREDKLASIRADYTTLTQAGYKPSAKVLSAIEARITGEVDETKRVLDYVEADEEVLARLTKKFEKRSRKFESQIAKVEADLAVKERHLKMARAANARNTPEIETEYQEIKDDLEDLNDNYMILRSDYEQESDYLKPKGKFTIEKAGPAYEKAQRGYSDYTQAYEGRVPYTSATKDQQKVLFHRPNIEREQAKEAARQAKFSKLKKAPQSIFGQGKLIGGVTPAQRAIIKLQNEIDELYLMSQSIEEHIKSSHIPADIREYEHEHEKIIEELHAKIETLAEYKKADAADMADVDRAIALERLEFDDELRTQAEREHANTRNTLRHTSLYPSPRLPRTSTPPPPFDSDDTDDEVDKGKGKPKVRRGSKPIGGHVHKSADPFGDQNELEPYLTKYLRPSKHRRNVQPIESSSDESSDGSEDEAHQINKPNGRSPIGAGKKNARKQKEDWDIILSQPKAEAGILIEKKRGRGRPSKASDSQAIKPAHTTAKSQDLWFM